MPGAGRTRSLVCKLKKANEHSHRGLAETFRHSLRNGFTAYSALSPETGLFCLRRPSIISRGLIPASGDQDHAPSPSASARIACAPLRPSLPAPRVVTIAIRPP